MNRRIERSHVVQVFGLSLFKLSSQENVHEMDGKAEAAPQLTLPTDSAVESEETEPLFVVNSLMLHDCSERLTQTEDESLIAVTGSCVDNVRSLERVVPVFLSTQSAVGVAAQNGSLANELLHLHEFGLRPLAFFHSHPGSGADATHPSSTDRHTQSLLEQSGSEVIGGIFSRDRFVRFYANGGQPNVRVVGKRIRAVEKNVYRLEAEEDVQEQAVEDSRARGGCR